MFQKRQEREMENRNQNDRTRMVGNPQNQGKPRKGSTTGQLAVIFVVLLLLTFNTWLFLGHIVGTSGGVIDTDGDGYVFDVDDKQHFIEDNKKAIAEGLTGQKEKQMLYGGIIADAAEEFDLDPYLIAGVIQTESGFDANVGNQYASGLMGVSDIGCIEMNNQGMVDPEKYPPSNILDPEVNVQYGSAILRWFLDHYDNDLPTVLAAYNAGPANADRWLALAGGGDISYVIDIAETRNYLKKVPENVEKMKAEYPDAF